MKNECTPEEFVRAWQESSSVGEVCRKTGIGFNTASGRARDYRERGIPLKMMRKGRHFVDVPKLKKLAVKLAPPASESLDDVKVPKG